MEAGKAKLIKGECTCTFMPVIIVCMYKVGLLGMYRLLVPSSVFKDVQSN